MKQNFNPYAQEHGKSAFVPFDSRLEILPLAVKKAFLAQQQIYRFKICAEITCSADIITSLLETFVNESSAFNEYRAQMTGATNGVLHCILMFNEQTQEGILLHKQNNNRLISCYPAISLEEAKMDYAFALDLLLFAEKVKGINVYLNQDLSAGRWNLGKLLTKIALQLDPLSCKYSAE